MTGQQLHEDHPPLADLHDPVCSNDRWDRAEHDDRCLIWASDDPAACDCRDARSQPAVGDTFVLGRLWLRVEAVTEVLVEFRAFVPGELDRRWFVTAPIPTPIVPERWTHQDLIEASAAAVEASRRPQPAGAGQ